MSGSKGGSKAPSLPTPAQLEPLLALQSKYNRVGASTPFGSQSYVTNADGTTTLKTDIGADGQAMIRRAGQLGMTDSARIGSNPQLDSIAGALAGRVGQRLGANIGGGPMSLVASPTQAQKPQQPTTATPPPPTTTDPYGPPPYNPAGGGNAMNPRRFPRDGGGY